MRLRTHAPSHAQPSSGRVLDRLVFQGLPLPAKLQLLLLLQLKLLLQWKLPLLLLLLLLLQRLLLQLQHRPIFLRGFKTCSEEWRRD